MQTYRIRRERGCSSQLAPSRGMYRCTRPSKDGCSRSPNSHPRAGCILYFTPKIQGKEGSQLAPSRGMYPGGRLHEEPQGELPTRTLARDVSRVEHKVLRAALSQLAPSRGMYPHTVEPVQLRMAAPNSHPRAGCIVGVAALRRGSISPNSHPRAGCIQSLKA